MEDILKLDELMSEEEIMIRDTVHKFIDKEAIPLFPDAFENARFPIELVSRFADMGLLGLTIPEKYGGAEASYIAYGLVCQELERGDSGLRSFVSVQNSLCMYPIYKFGTEEQKMKYLPAMARGEKIGCFGLTEPDAGSDPSSIKTRAKKVPNGWIINGSKMWITNGSIADLAIVWAQTDNGMRGFIVERGTKGFEQKEIKYKISLRASDTGELVFNDCFVPDENYLPGSERGLACPLQCLTQARYGIAWGAIGAAMFSYETALDYARERIQFGKPIAAFQLIQNDLAYIAYEILKAQLLNWRVGTLLDRGEKAHIQVSVAKGNASDVALKIARLARNILGANGISLEFHVARHMSNLESIYTYEGTNNIHRLIFGRHITGMNAFE